jgi:transcriptional regulator with XRE-family HTH domain
MITGAQIRAARGLIRWSAHELAERAKLGVATIRRSEAADGEPLVTVANAAAIRRALEKAGVEFTNGGQPGVRLQVVNPGGTIPAEELNASNDE